MLVSVIIRFKNEEKYLEYVLDAVSNQIFGNGSFEIIALDNFSTDRSADIARKYTQQVYQIQEYLPGKVLNHAISLSQGRYICVLSAHTIPANNRWLTTLYSHMQCPNLAGVYGAQLYPINSKFLDKMDLDIFSTDIPRVETANSDFWNANSMFPRRVWEQQPFDELVFELEDHYWTKRLLPKGYKVHFEPSALVYHYSHIKRIDREHLTNSVISQELQIEQAVSILQCDTSTWSEVMKAGLTLSSLTNCKKITEAVAVIGKLLLEHWDFDVRWRMAQALGKIPTAESASYLVSALNDESFYPRDEAAWSLGRLKAIGADVLRKKRDIIKDDYLAFVALALGLSSVESAGSEALEILKEELTSKSIDRIRNAIYFAGELTSIPGAYQLIPIIQSYLKSESDRLRMVACWAIGEYAFSASDLINWDELADIAKTSESILTRVEATVALGKLRLNSERSWVTRFLYRQLQDPASRVRFVAMQSLRHLVENGITLNDYSLSSYTDNDFGIMFELEQLRSSTKGKTSDAENTDH